MREKINKHISDLLCEHNCVIIPSFGGFVANYESAHIDKHSNHIQAPKKSIVFNRSLKNNDGLLVNEIAVVEGLTFKQAKVELDQYTKDLNESLELYKKVFIHEVGTLLLTSDNNILFVQSTSRNHLLDSYGLGSVQYPKIHRTSVQDRIEKKIKHIDKTHLPPNKKSWLRVAAVLVPLLMFSAFGLSNKDKLIDSYATFFPLESSVESTIAQPYASIHSVFNVNSPTGNISSAVRQYYYSKTQLNDELNKMTNVVEKHFIIAGAFSSEKNANVLIKRLKNKRFDNSKIIGQSQSGLYRVAYCGYENPGEALASLKKIRKTNPNAWLLSLQ